MQIGWTTRKDGKDYYKGGRKEKRHIRTSATYAAFCEGQNAADYGPHVNPYPAGLSRDEWQRGYDSADPYHGDRDGNCPYLAYYGRNE